MNGDMMVEPAEGGEIVWVVVSAIVSHLDVVRLEPIAAPTAGDATAAVARCHESAHCRRNGFGVVGSHDRFPVLQSDQLHRPGAEHLFEGLRPNPWTVFDFGAQLAAGAVGLV
jgi:hypothetical protein